MMLKRRLLAVSAAVACLAGLVACSPVAGDTRAVRLEVWRHDGTPEEQATFSKQVAAYNASQDRVHVALRTIPEGDYNDTLQAAAAGHELPDVAEVDGPLVDSYVYQRALVPLDDLVPGPVLDGQLPSLRAQDRLDGHTYTVSVFDSGLGLYADRRQLRAAGITWPAGLDDAWTATEFRDVLAALARRDRDHRVLDMKVNYGVGEWMTYGFSPLVASAGGDLVAPGSLQARGHLDGGPARRALRELQAWSSYVDPDADDHAFTSRRVALSWVGHWAYPDYAKALGDDLLVLPLPDLGSGPKTGQGSWTWGVTASRATQDAAADFLGYLLRDREVLRMTDANGAVPGTRSALAKSALYQPDGPLRLFAEQLLRSCGDTPQKPGCVAVPRPVTPGYPVLTAEFADAVQTALSGQDATPRLLEAATVVDQDVAANDGYR